MSKNVTNRPKVILEWAKPLGVKEKPYAYRWRLDFYYFSFRIHKWLCDDDTRAFHSHPVNMLSLILRGGYTDTIKERSWQYWPWQFVFIPRDHAHYVENIISPTWTLLFTWGVPKRWAFWDKITGKRLNRDKYFLENKNHICD